MEVEKKVKPSDMDSDLENELKKDVCYAPLSYHSECNTITNAHSISKSKHLKLIANKQGYVYSLKISSGIIHANNGKIIVDKISIRKSSAFYGFCEKHDKELFDAIDKIFILTDEQIFLNLYRTISKELYKKINISNHHINNMPNYDIGLNDFAKIYYTEYLKTMTFYTKIAIRDLKLLKNELDEKLINKDYSNFKYYALIINKTPDIMNTFPWSAHLDVENNRLIDITDISKSYNYMTISSFAYKDNKGILLFSWFDEIKSEECHKFIKQFDKLSNINKIKAFINLCFGVNEDIYFSQEWWESITKSKQDTLISLINSVVDFSNYRTLEVVDWVICDIKYNINL